MTRHHVVPTPPSTGAPGSAPVPDVEAWRRHRLLDAGFPSALAQELAAAPGVDVHALMALTDRGCPPGLAARILAPLDLGGRP
jgi:hypothetical protein